MRFTVAALFLLSLFSICPADTPSPGPLSIPDEASWLSYYSFRSSHPLLSRDALNSVLVEGHRLRLDAASVSISSKIIESPEDGFRSLNAMIDDAVKGGLDVRAAFAPTLSSLRSKSLEGKPEIAKNLESISERLDATPSPSADSRSGYLAWLAARCGTEDETPDAEYLKAFPDAPWDKGLLKFWGDLHYFARRFDKAIDLYRRALAKTSSPSSDRYSSFFEAEVRQRIGQCHLVCDRFDSAAVELERASALADPPESAVSRLLAAHGLIRAKSPDAALPLLHAALRDAGGPGAPLPDAIVNSLKVQEALAWSAKGDPKKVLELLAGVEKTPAAAFLLPSDRKLAWILLASGYRAAGDEEKAAEAAKRAEAEPPLSAAQKIDPMNERYEAFVETSASGLSHVAFYMGSDWRLDRVVLKGLANVPARPKVVIRGTDANGFFLAGCEVKAGEGLVQIDGDTFEIDIHGNAGSRQIDVQVTDPAGGVTVSGIIFCHLVGLEIQEVGFLNSRSLLVHFEDKNFNGRLDDGERLSDGNQDPTTWDIVRDTDFVFAGTFWSSDGRLAPCRYRKDDKPGFKAVFREKGAEGIDADVVMRYRVEPSFACSSGLVNFPEFEFRPGFSAATHDVWLYGSSALTETVGRKDEKFVWKWKARYGNLSPADLPCGVSDHRVYVTAGNPSYPYLCLVDHALKSMGKISDDRSPLEVLHAGLSALHNDADPGRSLVFSPMKEETRLYGRATQMDADLKMTLGRFLDAGRGNSTAWCKAFEAMAQVIGYEPDVRTMEWSNRWALSLSSTIEVLTTAGGVGQGNPELALFNKWLGSFPGIPSEKRGDIARDKPERWMPLPDHSVVLFKNGSKFDLVDPSFSGQPWAFQAGMFTEAPFEMPISENQRFVSDYFLKLAPSFRALGVPCHLKVDGGMITGRLDLSTDSVLLIDRPFDITFHYGAKDGKPDHAVADEHGPNPVHGEKRHAAVSEAPDADEISRDAEPADDPRIKSESDRKKRSSPVSSQELADLDEITALADSGKTASYVAALGKCKRFLEKYPLSDYYAFIGYIFSRMLILGVAHPAFETHYHIPGWWYQDAAFIAYKKLLFSSANQAHVAWQEKHAVDTEIFDGVADASLMLGRYAQMAGEYELAAGYLKGATNPYYKNHAPFILAALGETLSNYANEKPEKRGEAISARAKYLTEYGDRPDLEVLGVNVLYGLAADLLFAGRLDEAESVIKFYLDMVKDNPMTPGLKIMLAHVYAKKENPDYDEAESLLRGVYDYPFSGPYAAQSRAGFRPWAALVLTRMLVEKGDLSRAIDFASKHLVESNSFTGDLAPYKYFYSSWTRMHNAGISTQLARAYTMTGDHVAALKELDRFVQLYGDEDGDNRSKVGLPFPPFVFPVWGDDTGDWGALAHRLRGGQRINRSLKARPVEFGKVKVRFVNPFREAERFTRATVYYNTGRFDEAKEILEKLVNPDRTGSRDHLSMPVVGADQFLIALSPPFSNRYQEQAKELLKKIPYLKVDKEILVNDLSEKSVTFTASVVRGDGTPVDCTITATSDAPEVAQIEEASPVKSSNKTNYEFKIKLNSVGIYNIKLEAFVNSWKIPVVFINKIKGKIYSFMISEINFIANKNNDDYIQLKDVIKTGTIGSQDLLQDIFIKSPEYVNNYGLPSLINPVAIVRGNTPKYTLKIYSSPFIYNNNHKINKIFIRLCAHEVSETPEFKPYDTEIVINDNNVTELKDFVLPDLSKNNICNKKLQISIYIIKIEGMINNQPFFDNCKIFIKSYPIPVYYSWNKPLIPLNESIDPDRTEIAYYKQIAYYASNWASELNNEYDIVNNLYEGIRLKKNLKHNFIFGTKWGKYKIPKLRYMIYNNYGMCGQWTKLFVNINAFHGIYISRRGFSIDKNPNGSYSYIVIQNPGIGNIDKEYHGYFWSYKEVYKNYNYPIIYNGPINNTDNGYYNEDQEPKDDVYYHRGIKNTETLDKNLLQNKCWHFLQHYVCFYSSHLYDASFGIDPIEMREPSYTTYEYDLTNTNDDFTLYLTKSISYLGGNFLFKNNIDNQTNESDFIIKIDDIKNKKFPINSLIVNWNNVFKD